MSDLGHALGITSKPETGREQPPNDAERRNEEDRNGTIQVTEGCLVVLDPVGQGKPARIVPNPDTRLVKNGAPCLEPTEVWLGDDVTLEPNPDTWHRAVEVAVARDLMSATLKVGRGFLYEPCLVDAEPREVYNPQVVERERTSIQGALAELETLVKQKGVVHGLDRAAMERALVEGEEVTVAVGDQPVQPQHGEVEQLVAREVTVAAPLERENGSVDYREILKIPSVEPGDVIARVRDPIPGIPGRTVTGAIVQVPEARAAQLVSGTGTEFQHEGKCVVASIAGRPQLDRAGRHKVLARVVAEYIRQGDVDLSSGNIDFNGDVVITGDVTDTMTVKTTGSVRVAGSVSKAEINAGINIEVQGGTINSNLRAGGVSAAYTQALPHLQELHDQLGEIEHTLQHLGQHLAKIEPPQEAKLDAVANTLMTRVSPKVSGRLKDLAEALKHSPVPVEEVLVMTVRKAFALFAGPKTQEAFGDLLARIQGLLKDIEASLPLIEGIAQRQCIVKVGYAHNSRIESAGAIRVGERGSYASQLVSQGDIDVKGPISGGSATSLKGSIRAVVAGSPAEPKTHLAASPQGSARCHTVYPGVVFRSGRLFLKVTDKETDVRVHRHEGELTLR